MEWCMWWLQQQCGQHQRGQLFGVLVVVRVITAVLVRVILPSSSGPFLPPLPWFRTFGGCQLACAPRWAERTYTKHMCERGYGLRHVAMCLCAVAIAVDRKTADASRGLKWPEKLIPVPHVWNWS